MDAEKEIGVLEQEIKEIVGLHRTATETGSEYWCREWETRIRNVLRTLNNLEDVVGVFRTPPPIIYRDVLHSMTYKTGVMSLIAKDVGVTVYPGTKKKTLENDPEIHHTFIRRDCTGQLERLMPCADPDIHQDSSDIPVDVYSHVQMDPPKPDSISDRARPMTERDMYERAVLETAVRMFARDGFHAKGKIHWVPWKTRRKFKFREKVTRQFIKFPHVGGLGGRLIRRLIEGTVMLKPRETPLEFFRRGRKVISHVEPKYSCDWQQRKDLVGKLKALMESKRMKVSRQRLQKEGMWTVPTKPIEKVF